jgi:hypothetical protein
LPREVILPDRVILRVLREEESFPLASDVLRVAAGLLREAAVAVVYVKCLRETFDVSDR